jgi:hypothetical protein
MAATRARYIPALLETHAEDLAFVWGQRREALNSRLYTLREFGEVNERLEAHLQGLLIAPPEALSERLAPQLAAPDRDDAFAAGYTLLRLARPASTQAVVAEFSRAAGATLAGLRDALSLAPPALFVAEMQSALAQAKPTTAVAAAVVLANHRLLDAGSSRLAKFLETDDAALCALAVRAATSAQAAAANATNVSVALDLLANVVLARHADAAVRHAAWAALAWAGRRSTAIQPLRQQAEVGDSVALHWLAVLGTSEDVPLLQKAVLASPSAPQRCELLARFGHPMALNAFMRWMATDEIALAAAAGAGFTRMTGTDVRSERHTLPAPADADEFTRDMAPEVWLPNVKQAQALLERHGERWAAGERWCRDRTLQGDVSRETLAELDFEARWDVAARSAWVGRPVCAPAPIH